MLSRPVWHSPGAHSVDVHAAMCLAASTLQSQWQLPCMLQSCWRLAVSQAEALWQLLRCQVVPPAACCNATPTHPHTHTPTHPHTHTPAHPLDCHKKALCDGTAMLGCLAASSQLPSRGYTESFETVACNRARRPSTRVCAGLGGTVDTSLRGGDPDAVVDIDNLLP